MCLIDETVSDSQLLRCLMSFWQLWWFQQSLCLLSWLLEHICMCRFVRLRTLTQAAPPTMSYSTWRTIWSTLHNNKTSLISSTNTGKGSMNGFTMSSCETLYSSSIKDICTEWGGRVESNVGKWTWGGKVWWYANVCFHTRAANFTFC